MRPTALLLRCEILLQDRQELHGTCIAALLHCGMLIWCAQGILVALAHYAGHKVMLCDEEPSACLRLTTQLRTEYLWTDCRKNLIDSGSTFGVMPCPRLQMCPACLPSGVERKPYSPRNMFCTAFSMAGFPA